tara:strand:- start:116 stop:298 length:183 start_codon:yes stop_codon:yes gene_type:complete
MLNSAGVRDPEIMLFGVSFPTILSLLKVAKIVNKTPPRQVWITEDIEPTDHKYSQNDVTN